MLVTLGVGFVMLLLFAALVRDATLDERARKAREREYDVNRKFHDILRGRH